jgi:putative transcriptional regulator
MLTVAERPMGLLAGYSQVGYHRFVSWWDGSRLKRARERRGLTQQALADRLGVHQVTIARLETNARQPSMNMVERLARTLHVKPGDLLTLNR